MRWYKHLATSWNDERLSEVVAEFGLEGYGFWWRLLEIVAQQMDESDKCEASYSDSAWARKFGISKRKTNIYFEKFSEISLIFLEYDNSNCVGKLKIKIPNLLKYRDEYTRNVRSRSGQTQETLRSKKQIQKQIQNKPPISPKGEDGNFQLFWSAYPKKIGKGLAEKSFQKITAPKETTESILKALSWQVESEQWKKDNGQFIPNPATYLNQRRWEDEPKVQQIKKRGVEL